MRTIAALFRAPVHHGPSVLHHPSRMAVPLSVLMARWAPARILTLRSVLTAIAQRPFASRAPLAPQRTKSYSSTASADTRVVDEELCTSSRTPAHFINPAVAVKDFPGQGRGLIVKSALKQGDPILISQPLAILYGPADAMPSPEGLVDLLQPARQPTALHWLRHLYQGPDAPSTPAAQPTSELQSLLQQPVQTVAQDSEERPPSGGQHAVSSAQGVAAVSEEQAERLVAFNAFGDSFEDLVALRCQARHEAKQEGLATDAANERAARSHVGLWPHFSLLNHSCVPSCIHYVLDSTMVVRAVRDIAAGEQLTISYLGREDFSPVANRRRLLENRYEFVCECPRCRLEALLPTPVQTLLTDLHQETQQKLHPAFISAVQDDNIHLLKELSQPLINWSAKLHTTINEFKRQYDPHTPNPPPSHPQPTPTDAAAPLATPALSSAAPEPALAASIASVGGIDAAVLIALSVVFDFIELLQQHAQLSRAYEQQGGEGGGEGLREDDGGPMGTLRLTTDILHAVSRGSELHVFQTSRLLELTLAGEWAEVLGPRAGVEAAEAVEESLRCRYGHVSPELMLELARIAAEVSHEYVV